MKHQKKVLVFGGQYGAVGVIKALALEGIQTILFEPNPHNHASHSRFISQQVIIPNPRDDSKAILDILMSHNDWDESLLLPTIDDYVIFISKYRKELSSKYVFTMQDWEQTQRILNKDQLYIIAQKNGVPTPKFFLPDTIDFLYKQKDEFRYPCIIKPYESYLFRDVYKKKVLIIHDFQELLKNYMKVLQSNLRVMISEIIPGDDASIFSYRSYIGSQNEVVAELCSQKIRQYPINFGQSAVSRTIPMIPEIRDTALRILRYVNFKGQSSAEFKLDHRDNQYKLMEINIRPVLAEMMFAKAGINFPYLTYMDLCENVITPIPQYIEEYYFIHNHWEILNFLNSLRSGKLDIKKFLAPYFKKKKIYVVSFYDDPLHYIKELLINAQKCSRNN